MREEIIGAAVDNVTRAVVDALARGELPTPDALRLLLRAYAATGHDDVRHALEAGLANALEIAADSSSASAPRWLILFAEAADASDDERVRGAVSDLASKTKMIWRATRSVGDAAVSVDACLRANLDVQAAIDELERLVAAAYEPGEGIDGSTQDELSMVSALLTAFLLTDRLPYAMLAEELIQHTRRAAFEQPDLAFETACDLATVFSRMAALHANDEYRTAAVIAPDAHYADDAAVILERLAAEAAGRGQAGAAYGLAAGELQSAFPCR